MRNKQLLLWAIVLILAAGSFLAEGALGDNLRKAGSTVGTYLPWIVNTIILTLFIYFGLQLIGFKMEGSAQWFMLALIAIISFSVSRHVLGDTYIWSAKGILQNVFVIFKDTQKLVVGVASTVLFIWLFNHIGVGGKEGYGPKLNIVMAIIIGYNLAAQGASYGKIVSMGEIIAIFILYSNVKDKLGSEKMALVGTFYLVWYISSTAFPGLGLLGGITGTIVTIIVMASQAVLIWAIYAGEVKIFSLAGMSDDTSGAWWAKILRGGLSLVLVYGLSYGLNYIPWFKENVGMGFFSTGNIWTVLGFIIAAGVGLYLVFKGGKEEDKHGWSSGKIAAQFLGSEVVDLLNTIPGVAKHLQPRYPHAENLFPTSIRKLRLELITNMNYLLRLQVYKSKKNWVAKLVGRMEKEVFKEYVKGTRAMPRIKSDAYEYKVGSPYGQYHITDDQLDKKYNIDGTWKGFQIYFDRIHEMGKRDSRLLKDVGYAQTKLAIHMLMSELKRRLESKEEMNKSNEGGDFRTDLAKYLETKVIEPFGTKVMEKYKSFHNQRANYGRMILPHALSWQIFDQNLISSAGWNQHFYKFARPASRPYCVPVEVKRDNQGRVSEVKFPDHDQILKNIQIRNNPPYVRYSEKVDVLSKEAYGQEADVLLHEVDFHGRFLDDVNFINMLAKTKSIVRGMDLIPPGLRKDMPTPTSGGKVSLQQEGDKTYFRQILMTDSFPISSVEKMCDGLLVDWTYWIADFRGGIYHPSSRIAAVYGDCIDKGDYSFSKYEALKGTQKPDEEHPAFDREALKNPGKFQFRGKDTYYNEKNEGIVGEPLNDYPAITTFGFKEYITKIVRRMEGEKTANQFLSQYAWGAKGSTWFEKEPTLLGETKKGDHS